MKTHHAHETQIDKSDVVIIAPAALQEQLDALLGRATQRQVWMFFYEAGGEPIKLMMPVDGLPEIPDAAAVTDDLGETTFVYLLSERIHSTMGMTGAASCALVWERLGRGGATSHDLRWAHALARGLSEFRVIVQAQFLLNELEMIELPAADSKIAPSAAKLGPRGA